MDIISLTLKKRGLDNLSVLIIGFPAEFSLTDILIEMTFYGEFYHQCELIPAAGIEIVNVL